MQNISTQTWLNALDSGIRPVVAVLSDAGIETFESCEGGAGHAFHEPTVRFYGEQSEGFRALAVAAQHGLPVRELRRYWQINRACEPEGPHWEMTFAPTDERIPCTEGAQRYQVSCAQA